MIVRATYQVNKIEILQSYKKNDVEGNIQLTPTSALKENKISYSMRTKLVIQLLLWSNKRRRYKMLFKIAKKKKSQKIMKNIFCLAIDYKLLF